MTRERLAFALENLKPHQWGLFEEFAADYLTVDYPNLRTTASYHGDKGRDGDLVLSTPAESPLDMIQYSIAEDWKSKIRQTIKRIQDHFPNIRRLIYATNQEIGPQADELKQEIFVNHLVMLDIRDKSWFVERRESDPQRITASEDLSAKIVDPLLSKRNVVREVGLALSEDEARLGLLHLALQNKDEATGRGLTKESFDSLTLAALHDSSPENTIPRKEIHSRVTSFLPAGHNQQIDALVDATLDRLSKKGGKIKHFMNKDHFCLSYKERNKLADSISIFMQGERQLEQELFAIAESIEPQLTNADQAQASEELQSALEWVLLKQGESFALAARAGEMHPLHIQSLESILQEQPLHNARLLQLSTISRTILEISSSRSSKVRSHLRRLADGYTMFSFLRQTPDVQKVVVSMFSEGNFWLDTSVILPLIAETLIEDPSERHYTIIFRAAINAGIKLHVTDGIIEEVNSHLNRSLAFSRNTSTWVGKVPFVIAAYILHGKARGSFASWMEEFRGDMRPEEDVRIYLERVHGIKRRNLLEEAGSAPTALRGAIKELWYSEHERRRNNQYMYYDSFTTQRLVDHDVETTTGIMMLREKGSSSVMGHRYWLVTLDRVAFRLSHELPREVFKAPASPVLSPDFLSQYLRIGPLRTAIERDQRANLPLLADISKFDFVPKSLVDVADQLRSEFADLDERILQRKIRDTLDTMRMKQGIESEKGSKGAEERVLRKLEGNGNIV